MLLPLIVGLTGAPRLIGRLSSCQQLGPPQLNPGDSNGKLELVNIKTHSGHAELCVLTGWCVDVN